MKLLYKINLLSLLLGFLFLLLSILIFQDYDLRHSLKLSNDVIESFYLIIFIFIAIIIPVASNRWLNRSKFAMLLSILWIPYFFIWAIILGKAFAGVLPSHEGDYGGAIYFGFLAIYFPIYIFILALVGILFNFKKNL